VRQQIKVCIKKDPAAKIAAMSLTIAVEQVPLTADADGVIRVAGTRLPLDTILVAFHQGATAEEIAQRFPVIDLADVYAVISYYLHNRVEVDAYWRARREKANKVKELNETRTDPLGLRERLLARQK
jgi:uncharacterized protein (DUF433 family)